MAGKPRERSERDDLTDGLRRRPWGLPDGYEETDDETTPHPDQILQKLRDIEVLQAAGHSMAEIAKRFEVNDQTPHRWRNQFGDMKGEEMKRLKELKRENAQLKRLIADMALDNRMLKDLAAGNF